MSGAKSETSASGFPQKLLRGYADFRETRLKREKRLYENLAESGQKPETLVIACCDSRAAPETIFSAGPGEIFVVRNVANIMPPYEQEGDYHGAYAALEFAVLGLRVKHIVILGHGGCGGIAAFARALTDDAAPLSPDDFIGKWLSLLEPLASRLAALEDQTPERIQYFLELESIRQSMRRLEEFPFIRDLRARNQIGIHGAWFDIKEGELRVLDPEDDSFKKAQSLPR